MFFHKMKVAFGATLALSMTLAGALVWAKQTLKVDPPEALESPGIALDVAEASAPRLETLVEELVDSESASSMEVDEALYLEGDEADNLDEDQKSESRESGKVSNEPLGDGKPDGKKSLGGSGEMIELGMPAGASTVTGVKIHGSRYGQPQAPKESFLIYFLSKDRKRILHTEMAPYSLFKRGPETWVEVKFESPVASLPKSFWVILDFRAAQTKGVYVSFDTTTGGKFSRIGLPGMPSSEVNFGGDWMIQAIFAE
jgi:RNA polymerase sigma-70 factor (ECF subfamily)